MQKPVGEQYWLDSASNISFFMEEDALGEDGKLNRDQSVAVNKVGHGNACGLSLIAAVCQLQGSSTRVRSCLWLQCSCC